MSNLSSRTLPVSVIVPSRERPRLLHECVASILAGDKLPRELVIVDQSTDENRALTELATVNGCCLMYRHSPTTGGSAARNEACAVAGEDTLVFTDDDVLVAPDWLGVMFRAVEDAAVSELISGRVRFRGSPQEGVFAPSLIDEDLPKVYEGRPWTDALWSNNMAFARVIFERLGPFDVRLGAGGAYPAAEDNDYCFRALEAGYRIRYVPDAIVYHQAWRSQQAHSRLHWSYGVGQGAFLTKHTRLSDRYMLIRLRNDVVRHTRMALQKGARDRDAAKADAAYALGLLYGSARWTLSEKLRGR